MVRISRAVNATAGRPGSILVGTLAAAVLWCGIGTAKADAMLSSASQAASAASQAAAAASQATTSAAQSAVRDARDRIQLRQWAHRSPLQHRSYHWGGRADGW
jgi:hypothetical protein